MSELVCRTLELLAESKDAFASAVKNIFNTKTMATLKISDLSVGDWVQDKNGIYAKVIGVENWSNGYLLNIELHGVNVGVTPLASVHPIPITPEILEANGFVKIGEYNEWSTGNWEDIPFIGISLSRQSMRIKNLGTDIFLENKVVYVHQLQRALSLANIDKEITL